ncbi:MAG: translation elongation factor Ts [Desulfobaccales bacterium]
MEITAELVKTLRDRTDAGMMDCKKALKETAGDLEAAVVYLRQKGLAVATKRAGRMTTEGCVWAHVSPDHQSGVLLEVNCESDFVAKTDSFQDLGSRLAEQLAAAALETVEELLSQGCTHSPGLNVADYVNEVIAKTGEKCQVRRFSRYRGGLVAAYIHHGGKIGVLLQLSGGDAAPEAVAAARDLAMQVAAANPLTVSREQVPAETVSKEKAIYAAQAQESGKPAQIIEKMVVGRLEKFYKEACLLEQPFVKNPEQTVGQFLKEVGKKLGKELQVKGFSRFQVGV